MTASLHAVRPRRRVSPPELPLFTTNTLDLLPLFFLSAFHVLEVSRNPFVFSALVDEFQTVFFKCGDRIQRKVIVGCHQVRGPGDDHGRDGLVRFKEILNLRPGNCNEMRFYKLGILDDAARVDYRCERLGGKVTPIARQPSAV